MPNDEKPATDIAMPTANNTDIAMDAAPTVSPAGNRTDWKPSKEMVRQWAIFQELNHYEVLELSENATDAAIQARMVQLAKRLEIWSESQDAQLQEIGRQGRQRLRAMEIAWQQRSVYDAEIDRARYAARLENYRQQAMNYASDGIMQWYEYKTLTENARSDKLKDEDVALILTELRQKGVDIRTQDDAPQIPPATPLAASLAGFPFGLLHDQLAIAKNPRELAALLEKDPDRGIQHLYKGAIATWLTPLDPGLAADIRLLVETEYPGDQKAGLIKAIYLLDPERKYRIGVFGECTTLAAMGLALENTSNTYRDDLTRDRNAAFFLYLEARGYQKLVERFRRYIQEYDASTAWNRIIRELQGKNPDTPVGPSGSTEPRQAASEAESQKITPPPAKAEIAPKPTNSGKTGGQAGAKVAHKVLTQPLTTPPKTGGTPLTKPIAAAPTIPAGPVKQEPLNRPAAASNIPAAPVTPVRPVPPAKSAATIQAQALKPSAQPAAVIPSPTAPTQLVKPPAQGEPPAQREAGAPPAKSGRSRIMPILVLLGLLSGIWAVRGPVPASWQAQQKNMQLKSQQIWTLLKTQVQAKWTTGRQTLAKNLPAERSSDQGKNSGKKISASTLPQSRAADIQLILVSGGSFKMGQGRGEPDERPVHQVTVTDFLMGRYEVTVREYADCVFSGACNRAQSDNHCNWGRPNRLDHPVNCLTWLDAAKYANWLSEKDQLSQCYQASDWSLIKNCQGYRLPTEAEWEYAARGGNKSRGTTYSGSQNPDDVAWHNANAGNETHPVGKKRPNELGLYDLTGNVWEWVNDWYDDAYYGHSPRLSPTGPITGINRAYRGGGWDSEAIKCQVTNRSSSRPSGQRNNLGFRLVRNH
jgi:formylglycine-generating enzyme required for sulfatase activity